MTANTTASFGFQTNRKRSMMVYDNLSPRLRSALRECAVDLSPEQVARLRMDEEAIVELIRTCDKQNLELLIKEYYSDDHPQLTKS